MVHRRVRQNRFTRLWWVLQRQLRRLHWYRHDLHIRYRMHLWIYASKIFLLRIRFPCVSLCIEVHCILNFVIARSVPYMISNIGYGTYFLFAAFITISVPWVFFFVPETKGLSLVDMDVLFGLPQIEHL